ncbi:MAG: AI-2E family transporter [Candidatus Saccharibacteria bacterium]
MFGFNPSNRYKKVGVTVSNRTVIRVLLLTVVSFIGLLAVKRAEHALVLLFTAFFLSLALNAPVHWLAERIPGKRRGSRVLGTALSFLFIIAVLSAFLASIVPPLVRQTNIFISAAPHLVEEVRNQDGAVGQFVRKYHLQKQVDNVSTQLSNRLKNDSGLAFSTAGRVGSSIFSVLTILVLTFMMLIEGPRWLKLSERFVPSEHHDRVERLAADMYRVVKGYVNGQVILALIASMMLLPALLVLGISYPAALIVIVFICGLIPMVGHTIGAIIVTSVALFHSLPTAGFILAYYILYQQIENYIIQPRIQANSTNMSPLLVFASVIVGVNFGGLFGGLVAIPVAGCFRIFMIDYMRTKHLIDNEERDELANHPQTAEL